MADDDQPVRGGAPRLGPRATLLNGVTLLLSALVACSVFCIAFPRTPSQRIESLEHPVQSVERLFERNLAVEDALANAPRWMRRAVELALLDFDGTLGAAIDAYDEVLRAPPPNEQEPLADLPGLHTRRESAAERAHDRLELQARRAVLLAEADRVDEAERALGEIDANGGAEIAALLRRAYALGASDAGPYASFDLAPFGEGWVADRVRLRLAERTGESMLEAQLRADARERNRYWRERVVELSLALGIPWLAGLALLLAWLWKDRPVLVDGHAPIPPPWTFESGWSVVVRAAFAGLAISVALLLIDETLGVHVFGAWPTLIASIPMLWWIRKRLLAPNAQSFVRAFGLRGFAQKTFTWIGFTLGLFALTELGSAMIPFVCSAFGIETHWTDALQEDLIWGSRTRVLFNSFDLVAWAPVLEEIGFRGLLFMTFRRRAGPFGAALLSSSLFGIVHGYSLPGFLDVCWSGLVFALAYERSRSLVPGMIGHAFNNAIVLATAWVLYR